MIFVVVSKSKLLCIVNRIPLKWISLSATSFSLNFLLFFWESYVAEKGIWIEKWGN